MPSPSAVLPATRAALIVERYAVYDEFAAGGMATVHFARLLGAQGFRRTVAAKRLLPHLTRDRDFALMLVDEARLAARVRHPNVVSTLDVVQAEGELLLVMDYIHGESLAKLAESAVLLGERVPLAIATAIVIDALHGLHAAHEAHDEGGQPLGLVHRDVSPQNVLVGVDGVTRIADFGVAKAQGRAHTTREGVIKGKLAYMAPEQLNAAEVSPATDVFAASVVLWELCACERLFAGATPAETMFKVMSAPIPALGSRATLVSPALEATVMRGLERDVAKRFSTAREMALALEANAPSVRPSEIAAWVERIAGARLSQRASILRAIEHEGHVDPDAVTNLVQPRAALDVSRELEEGQTGKRRREHAPPSDATFLRSGAETQASTPAPSQLAQSAPTPAFSTQRARRRRLGFVALLALLVLVLAWAGTAQRSSPRTERPADPAHTASSRPHTAPSSVLPSRVVEPASAAPSSAPPSRLVAPASAAPTAREPSGAPELTGAAQVPPPASAPEAALEPANTKTVPVHESAVDSSLAHFDAGAQVEPAANHPRRARQLRKNDKGCDPPYSIDAAGRVLFKVECM